jgi:cyclopropane-fatty-acyl-phospholipid synthase
MSVRDRWSKRVFFRSLDAMSGGRATIVCPDGTRHFDGTGRMKGDARPPLDVTLVLQSDRFFTRVLTGGEIALGESYMDGEISSPDLVALLRMMLRNLAIVDDQGGVLRAVNRWIARTARRLRDNSLVGSRRHIREHYDLGNDFFRLFLDEHLMYSCAFYASEHDTLEQAQQHKLDMICRKLDLGPGDHVLEIGSGWGGFAVWAATRYGCRVTTTTISAEQHRHVREWTARLGEAGARVQVLLEDYRELQGRFDKIVSIEMFEAVGLNHYDDYFRAVDRLLAPDGSMLLQTITVDDQRFPSYHGTPDWIEKYIFPGSELAAVGEVLKSVARVTSLSLHHAENIGTHYARTLHEWRARFHRHLDRVRALGYSERFIRMWDLYLAACEAAFLERQTGNFQLLLTKRANPAVLFNEPWSREAEASAVA